MTLYAIGDLQGCDDAFAALLERIEFDPRQDRLWLVGDLVNRGPASLPALRRVIGLGNSVTTVLGNHDLHLLAAAAGARRVGGKDTFSDVLRAHDAEALLDWLRHRPLMHVDPQRNRVLVHAGIPPAWSVAEAQSAARDVETRLRSTEWRAALGAMYGNEPSGWRVGLSDAERMRFTINGLTRMRFVHADGTLDFDCTGPPGSQPAGLTPWFDVPRRAAANAHIVFGHWSALGVVRRDDMTALDSGCVWGRTLTAVALDADGPEIAVECRSG